MHQTLAQIRDSASLPNHSRQVQPLQKLYTSGKRCNNFVKLAAVEGQTATDPLNLGRAVPASKVTSTAISGPGSPWAFSVRCGLPPLAPWQTFWQT